MIPWAGVRRQPHWCSRSRVDGQFGSNLGIFTEVRNCWTERILPRNLTWIAKGRRGDRQGSRRRKAKEAAAENSSRTGWPVDRPGRPDVHNVHRIRRRSTDRSTADPDCKCPTLCWAPGRPPGRPVEESGQPPGRPHHLTVSAQLSVGHPGDRSVDRGKRSVDRPVDRQLGAGKILLFRKSVYLRLLFNSRVLYLRKRIC